MKRNNELNEKIKLQCGYEIVNRIAKAATTECLADPLSNLPNKKHFALYRNWASSEPGILITGNIMIDKRYREAPRNIVLEENSEKTIKIFKEWAKEVKTAKTQSGEQTKTAFIAQISHPGRQSPFSVTSLPVAPSPVPVVILKVRFCF